MGNSKNSRMYGREEIKKRLLEELKDCLMTKYADDSIIEDSILIDIEDRKVSVTFDFTIVEEDDYIGLGQY